MNTSKQINAMIGLLFVSFLLFGAYALNEGNRLDDASEDELELQVRRGAKLFVQGCRACHGMDGEGHVGPRLNTPAFLVLEEGNEFGVEATPQGEADAIHDFLFNTIACGRTGTAMPFWAENFGGSMSNTQIEQIVAMITNGRWDLVEEIGHDEDSHQEPPATRETILVSAEDAGTLALTKENCGQYNAITALPFRQREDPRLAAVVTPEPTETPSDGETPEPVSPDQVITSFGITVADLFQANCSACHGQDRKGLIGPELSPTTLTQPDDFYTDTITNGRAGTVMPAWGGQLTADDINALVQFLKKVEP
jgi:mono/diheme cytochrome c family protein